MEYTVKISGRYYGDHTFPSLNDYIAQLGKSPHAGAKMKRDYQTIAVNAIRRQLKKTQVRGKVWIEYTFCEPDAKRDPSNIASFFVKVFEDALQKCEVIKNDNFAVISGYSQSFAIKPNSEPYVIVKITEVDT